MPIRAATSLDIAAMRRLAAAAPGAAQWTEEQYLEIFGSPSLRHAIVLEEHEQVIGFAVARTLPEEWELENIVIRATEQRAGRGCELLNALLHRAAVAGAKHFRLEVRESNRAACRLYEKCGCHVQGRRRSYYRDPVEDAILYHRGIALR